MEINSDNEDIGLNGFDSYLNNIIRKSRMGRFIKLKIIYQQLFFEYFIK